MCKKNQNEKFTVYRIQMVACRYSLDTILDMVS